MPPRPDLSAEFTAAGAVCLRQLVPAELLVAVTAAVEANLADPSPMSLVASQPGDPGRFVEDFWNWHRFGAYLDLATAVAPAVAALIGSSTLRLHHDHLLVKYAGTTSPTPWHQDQPYYDLEGRDVVSLWVPVDPVAREDTLEFLAGSHLGPWLMPRTFRDRQAKWFAEGTLADVPAIDADREAFDILGWELKPGDAVLFHALTLHSSAGARRDRRVVSLRFLGDDAVRVERPWDTSPQLPPEAVFPVVWQDGPVTKPATVV